MRFVMYHKIYNQPVIKHFFKQARAIPVAPMKEDPELLEKAYDRIAVIFPEGGLTPDGELQELKPGITKILERTPVPVIPMAISGLWGTWFSRKGGRAMKGLPRSFMKKIDSRRFFNNFLRCCRHGGAKKLDAGPLCLSFVKEHSGQPTNA